MTRNLLSEHSALILGEPVLLAADSLEQLSSLFIKRTKNLFTSWGSHLKVLGQDNALQPGLEILFQMKNSSALFHLKKCNPWKLVLKLALDIDISVSRLLPIFEGFGFGEFGLGKKVSVSVSENLVSEEKYRFQFRKNLVSEKSLGFGIGKFGIVKKVSVSVSVKILVSSFSALLGMECSFLWKFIGNGKENDKTLATKHHLSFPSY